jgi:hypothetical protein
MVSFLNMFPVSLGLGNFYWSQMKKRVWVIYVKLLLRHPGVSLDNHILSQKCCLNVKLSATYHYNADKDAWMLLVQK